MTSRLTASTQARRAALAEQIVHKYTQETYPDGTPKGIRAIARELGTSTRTVHRVLCKADVPRRKPGAPPQPEPSPERAALTQLAAKRKQLARAQAALAVLEAEIAQLAVEMKAFDLYLARHGVVVA